MKKAALVLSLALLALSLPTSARATQGAVVGCSSIKVDNSVKKGISLPCLDNKSHVTYQAIRGPVVVNVFGSWCEPCNQEIPHLLDLQSTHKVSMIGIDVEEANMQAGKNFVIKKGITWPVLFDTTSVTRGIFGLGVPVTWFIDSHGKVIYRQIGLITSTKELKDEVTKYLKIKL